MDNKYNINLINQYKNQDFYEEKLFDFILNDTDVNELKNEQFDIGYHHNITVKGNLESFLYKGIVYNEPLKIEMHNKMHNKWSNQLLKPLYFIKFNQKEYVLEQSGYEVFQDISKGLKKIAQKQIEPLTDTEEKFVIDWFFKETPIFYLTESNTEEVNELFTIFLNQKDYVNKKNDKSTVNNFFAHHGIKKVLALFTQEQRESLMKEKIDFKEVIKAYYPKLLNQKHFDLASQLQSFDSKEIVQYLTENISPDPEVWFKRFLEKGSGLTIAYLHDKLNLKPIPSYYVAKPAVHAAITGAIDLLQIIHNDFPSENIVKLLVATIIEGQKDRLYKQLRTFIELPQDEEFGNYMNQKAMHKKSMDYYEKEILKDKLELKFANKPKAKTSKI